MTIILSTRMRLRCLPIAATVAVFALSSCAMNHGSQESASGSPVLLVSRPTQPEYASQDPVGDMSFDEARAAVLELVAPPTMISTRGSLKFNISQVLVRSNSITIVANDKKFKVRFLALHPRTLILPETKERVVCVSHMYWLLGPPTRQWSTVDAPRLAVALRVLKDAALAPPSESDEPQFQEIANAYRSAQPKPELPETARRFRVQALGAVRDKDFDGAVDLYSQALVVAPWWPEGHYNRALVLAEISEIRHAIVEMQRYLSLVPEAGNARAVQDQIYDWERKANAEMTESTEVSQHDLPNRPKHAKNPDT
jgi:hypothetical protein